MLDATWTGKAPQVLIRCLEANLCWSAKKKQFVDMSSAKAEYPLAAGCCANILWMKSQLSDHDIVYEKVPIFYYNPSAIAISNNLILHSRTKHIDIKSYFIKDHIIKGDIELHFIPTQYQFVDIFSKPRDVPTFQRVIVELGRYDISVPALTKDHKGNMINTPYPEDQYAVLEI
ncbi:hypothetical protein Tco_0452337 [Tanacetum coccineum]